MPIAPAAGAMMYHSTEANALGGSEQTKSQSFGHQNVFVGQNSMSLVRQRDHANVLTKSKQNESLLSLFQPTLQIKS
jgi:hypothetical protein